MKLDSKIWGPHYWFFLHTTALSYPRTPNSTVKKKFYDLIQNFHLFIPDINISRSFNKLLDDYPVSPYLDSKDSLVKWTHFIHNKINRKLEKPVISLEEFYKSYYKQYDTPLEKHVANIKSKKYLTHIAITCVFILIICVLYNK